MKIKGFLLSLLVSFLFSLWTHRIELSDKYAAYNDAGIYYLLRAQAEPGSMKNDLLAQTFKGGALASPSGVRLLSGFMLPVEKAAMKLMGLREMLLLKSILLQTLTCTASFVLARALGFGVLAWGFLALFTAYFSSTNVFFGGLHRSYAPLLCLALYYCAEKRLIAGALAVCAGVYAFYGASLPLACCVVILLLIGNADAKRRRYGWILLALFAAVPFILRFLRPDIVNGLGVAFAWKSSLNAREFFWPEIYLFNANDHREVYRWLTWALAAASGAALFFYRSAKRRFHAGDKMFFGAIALSFAWAWLIDHGFASRQTVYSLPLLLALFPFRYLVSAAPGKARTAALWSLTALPLLAFFCFEDHSRTIARVSPATMRPLSALPPDSVIFSHPETAPLLGFFTGRAAYSNERWETALCGLTQNPLCEEAKERQNKTFEIYYGASSASVSAFAASSGVTHFLVEEEFYSPDYFGFRLSQRYRFIERSARSRSDGSPALLELARKKGAELEPGVWLLEAGKFKGPKI